MLCHPLGDSRNKSKCKDVKLDLEKSSDTHYASGQQVKTFGLFTPAVITLFWVYRFNAIAELSIPDLLTDVDISPPISKPHPQILHCNFRI